MSTTPPEVLVINAEIGVKEALYSYLSEKEFHWSAYYRHWLKEHKFQLAGKIIEAESERRPFGVILYDVGSKEYSTCQEDSTWKNPPPWFLKDIWEPAYWPPIVLLTPMDRWQDILPKYEAALKEFNKESRRKPIVLAVSRTPTDWKPGDITLDVQVTKAWEEWEKMSVMFPEDIMTTANRHTAALSDSLFLHFNRLFGNNVLSFIKSFEDQMYKLKEFQKKKLTYDVGIWLEVNELSSSVKSTLETIAVHLKQCPNCFSKDISEFMSEVVIDIEKVTWAYSEYEMDDMLKQWQNIRAKLTKLPTLLSSVLPQRDTGET